MGVNMGVKFECKTILFYCTIFSKYSEWILIKAPEPCPGLFLTYVSLFSLIVCGLVNVLVLNSTGEVVV